MTNVVPAVASWPRSSSCQVSRPGPATCPAVSSCICIVTDELAVIACGRCEQFKGPRAPTVVGVLRGTTLSCSPNCGQPVSGTVVLVGLVSVTAYSSVDGTWTVAGAVTVAVNVAKVAGSAAEFSCPYAVDCQAFCGSGLLACGGMLTSATEMLIGRTDGLSPRANFR